MKKLAISAMVACAVLAGCGQSQQAEKEKQAQADEQLRKVFSGSCTRVRTYDEIKRGEKCK